MALCQTERLAMGALASLVTLVQDLKALQLARERFDLLGLRSGTHQFRQWQESIAPQAALRIAQKNTKESKRAQIPCGFLLFFSTLVAFIPLKMHPSMSVPLIFHDFPDARERLEFPQRKAVGGGGMNAHHLVHLSSPKYHYTQRIKRNLPGIRCCQKLCHGH